MTKEEILQYMRENTHLTGYKIAKNLGVRNATIYDWADEHGIELGVITDHPDSKSKRNAVKTDKIIKAIRANPTFTTKQLAELTGEAPKEVARAAEALEVVLPKEKSGRKVGYRKPEHLKVKKPEKKPKPPKPISPEKVAKIIKQFKEPGSHKPYIFDKPSGNKKEEEWLEEDAGDTAERSANQKLIESERRKKEIRDNRPKGEYTQSRSPYGLTEEFGISVKTKK